jgi:hypothetical protein
MPETDTGAAAPVEVLAAKDLTQTHATRHQAGSVKVVRAGFAAPISSEYHVHAEAHVTVMPVMRMVVVASHPAAAVIPVVGRNYRYRAIPHIRDGRWRIIGTIPPHHSVR